MKINIFSISKNFINFLKIFFFFLIYFYLHTKYKTISKQYLFSDCCEINFYKETQIFYITFKSRNGNTFEISLNVKHR